MSGVARISSYHVPIAQRAVLAPVGISKAARQKLFLTFRQINMIHVDFRIELRNKGTWERIRRAVAGVGCLGGVLLVELCCAFS